jgi:NAD(P)-dependent dehydrogenase (short-subunit alcohol dehydrogenase family)
MRVFPPMRPAPFGHIKATQYLYDTDAATGAKTNRRLPTGIVEDSDFARVIAINLLGSYYVAQAFTPLLLVPGNANTARTFIVMTVVNYGSGSISSYSSSTSSECRSIYATEVVY